MKFMETLQFHPGTGSDGVNFGTYLKEFLSIHRDKYKLSLFLTFCRAFSGSFLRILLRDIK